MLRANHFTGGAITGAVSAIDIALWDIKGKASACRSTSCWAGRMRHKARLYGHVKGRTIEKLVEEAVRLKEAGFTALGHLNPLLDEERGRAVLQVARRARSRRRSTTCAGCARRSGRRSISASRSIAG